MIFTNNVQIHLTGFIVEKMYADGSGKFDKDWRRINLVAVSSPPVPPSAPQVPPSTSVASLPPQDGGRRPPIHSTSTYFPEITLRTGHWWNLVLKKVLHQRA